MCIIYIMKIHIILPFNRYSNKDTIINFLMSFKDYIIVYPIEEIQNKSEWVYDWIKPCICPTRPDNWDPVYYKLNYFINHTNIIEDDYYFVFSDDNLFQENLISEIQKCLTDIMFISVKFNTTINLTPIPDNKKSHSIGNCGLYNFIVKGHILKKYTFENIYYGDGLFMEYLFNNSELSKTYKTDIFALYDYLNPNWPK